MRRPKREYELDLDPNADYKEAHLHDLAREEFESIHNWLYLGADVRDGGFAKVGMTMDDLGSRSSNSGRPSFYIFCAFKCRSNISRSKLEYIEDSAFNYLDQIFVNPDGSTKRELHAESGRLSECYYGINFMDFFIALHDYLYDHFYDCFSTTGYENEVGIDEGHYIDCEFNPRLSRAEINRFRRRVLRL